jgi:uncharacterized membrane protein
MARAKTADAGGEGLLDSLRGSSATKRLGEEARNFFDAGTSKLTGKIGDGVGGAAKKLTDIGDSGSLGSVGEGAKRLLSGDGPVKSAVGAATSGIADKAKGLLGKGGGKGGGKSKAMNIEETIDIGVPVSVAYDQWTQFTEFSRFMKGVQSVEQTDDTETTWRGKVFKSTRTWKAKIQEQVPDRRIVWTSNGPKGSTKGVVTFHPLADDLTRVLVAIEYYPGGLVEKTGNLWRAAGRRIRLDLKSYRRFVMMENEATGSWRGEIHDGEVVKGPEDADDSQDDSDDRDDDAQNSSDEDTDDNADEDEDEDEDEQDEDEDEQDEDEDEQDEDEDEDDQEDDVQRSRRPTGSGRTRKQPAKKSTPRKQPAKKSTPRKQPAAKKTTARKQPAAKKTTARKQPAKKATARKQPAKKSASRSSSPTKRAPARKSTARKSPARKSTARKSPARKSTARKSTSRSRSSR